MPNRSASLRDHLTNAADRSGFLFGAAASVCPVDLLGGTSLGGRLAELSGLSILLTTRDQLAAALALVELDGVASRIIICPPDMTSEHLPALMAKGGVDAIVSDDNSVSARPSGRPVAGRLRRPVLRQRSTQMRNKFEQGATEWVLLTSGTSGAPKMIVHTLASLTAPIGLSRNVRQTAPCGERSTIFAVTAVSRYSSRSPRQRIASYSRAPTSLSRIISSALGAHGVTHLSGTPSHWRRALMSPQAHGSPHIRSSVGRDRRSGDSDGVLQDRSGRAVGHAFASTEAGVAFEVNDGLAGFPASLVRYTR